MIASKLTDAVLAAGLRVHQELGNGLLPEAYRVCMVHELDRAGLQARERISVGLRVGDTEIVTAAFLDILVEDRLAVSVLARSKPDPTAPSRLLSTMRVGGFGLGLVLDFGGPVLKDRVQRLVSSDPEVTLSAALTAPSKTSRTHTPSGRTGRFEEPSAWCDSLAAQVVDCSVRLHNALGNGLTKEAYEACLKHLLLRRGLRARQQVPLPIVYDGITLGNPYRIDMLVEESLVVELKTIDQIGEVHQAQLLSYLRLGRYPLGLLLNFRSTLMKDGIKRVINSRPCS